MNIGGIIGSLAEGAADIYSGNYAGLIGAAGGLAGSIEGGHASEGQPGGAGGMLAGLAGQGGAQGGTVPQLAGAVGQLSQLAARLGGGQQDPTTQQVAPMPQFTPLPQVSQGAGIRVSSQPEPFSLTKTASPVSNFNFGASNAQASTAGLGNSLGAAGGSDNAFSGGTVTQLTDPLTGAGKAPSSGAGSEPSELEKGASGALAGAATGAEIGSVVPGIGTVIGGVLGGIGGFLASIF